MTRRSKHVGPPGVDTRATRRAAQPAVAARTPRPPQPADARDPRCSGRVGQRTGLLNFPLHNLLRAEPANGGAKARLRDIVHGTNWFCAGTPGCDQASGWAIATSRTWHGRS